MVTNNDGLELIKKYEGFSSKPYLCPANIPTIGWGSTRYADGTKVTMKDKSITKEEEGDILFKETLKIYEKIVNKKIKVTLNCNQFSALVSHTYNTGGSDTLFKLINEGKPSNEIREWWTTRYITGGGVKLNGLIKRRWSEYELYNK
jgi:lysozyme